MKKILRKRKEKNPEEVDLSWQRYLLPPVHKEGVKIIGVALGIVLVLGLLSRTLFLLGLPALAFVYYFFRNPERVSPTGDDLVLAPADGIVSNITEYMPPKALGLPEEPLTRVSIFMSVFNVHVNRAPISGTVTKLHYNKGKFVSVAEKDSEDNERQEILMTTPKGTRVAFTQIAGLVARRIYCPLHVGEQLKAGQIFGMIRFGSRLDVFLPKGVVPEVKLGQTMVAGETVLAHLKEK